MRRKSVRPFLVAILFATLALSASADPFDVVAPAARLTPAQRQWLETFEAGARVYAGTELPAVDWLTHATRDARQVGLAAIADYLDTAAETLRGSSSSEELEQAFRRTLDEPVYVVLRIAGGRLIDVVVAVPRSAPGDVSRLATLRFRAGSAVRAAAPATDLPFETTLEDQVGRTHIVYDNLLTAGWFATRVKPAAEKVLPSVVGHVTPQSHIRWFTMRQSVSEGLRPAAVFDRYGTDAAALKLLRGDVFGTLASGLTDDDLATLVALTLTSYAEAIAGDAPPPNKTAAAILINVARERGALRFQKDAWAVDLEKLAGSVRWIAGEILRIEEDADPTHARAFIAKYGVGTPDLERTGTILNALPVRTIEPRYQISPAGAVLSYLGATSREAALAHLTDDYHLQFGESDKPLDKGQAGGMLRWDYALDPEHRVDTLVVDGDVVMVQQHETNDFARLLGFPGWDARATYVVREGLIASQHYEPMPGQPDWHPYLEKALPWLEEHFPQAMARLYVDGRILQTEDAAKEWVEILRAWRNSR